MLAWHWTGSRIQGGLQGASLTVAASCLYCVQEKYGNRMLQTACMYHLCFLTCLGNWNIENLNVPDAPDLEIL